jgi:uncharacterized C2H2 Zn-finger protein
MVNELVRSVKSVLADKAAVASRERQLIEDLNRVLPEIGYRVVPATDRPGAPAARETAAAVQSELNRRQPAKIRDKSLQCPHCDRRFARPLHLGRHMSATHSRAQSRGQSRRKKAA